MSTTTPTSGAKGVGRKTNLTADFSDGVSGKMDPASITTATFKLYRCPSTTSTECTTQITNVSVALSTDLKATLDPFGTSSTLLGKKTRYKAVVTTGAADVAGNALAQDKVWYFTTGKK